MEVLPNYSMHHLKISSSIKPALKVSCITIGSNICHVNSPCLCPTPIIPMHFEPQFKITSLIWSVFSVLDDDLYVQV